MTLNGNIDINKIKIPQEEIQTTSIQTKPSDANVEIFTKSNDADIYTKLGITKEQYLKISNKNPAFLQMDFDAQLNYIRQLNNAEALTVTASATSVQLSETQNTTISANAEIAFNKKNYSKLPIDEQFKIYTTELAKNKFLYGDKKSPNTLEDWNKLSKTEQEQLINAEKRILEPHKGTLNEKNSKIWLDKSMTELQAANFYQISQEEFQKSPQGRQDEIVYDYLFGQDEGNLSISDKLRLNETELLANAVSHAAKSEERLCPEEAREYLLNNKISPIKAQYDYLKNKQANGEELTKYEQAKFKQLAKIKNLPIAQEVERDFGKRTGEVAKLRTEIAHSSKLGEAYENAKGTDRGLILKQYLEDTYDKNDPKYQEIIKNLIVDAAECADLELIDDLYSLAKTNKRLGRALAESDNKFIKTTTAFKADKMSTEDIDAYVRKRVANPNDPDNEHLVGTVQKTCSEEAMESVAKATQNAKWQSIINGNVYMGHRAKNPETQIKIAKIIKAGGNQEAIELTAATAHLNKPEAQQAVLNTATKDNEGATHAAIKANVAAKMDKENQATSVKMLMERNEAYTKDEEEAKRYSTQLANQVETLDASQQAEAHKYVSQSQYEEVVQQAAENIYKYDQSAQKEALKYTIDTGNEKAIEKAVANVDKCEGLSNETSATPSNSKDYNVQLAKTIKTQQTKIERVYTTQVAEQYADYMVEQAIRSGIISPEDAKSEKEKYIEEFKTPSSNKFALLGKLEPGQKKEALKILVKFAPTLINSFIDMGYGAEILRVIGETSDLAEKIVKLMDFKGQPEARNIVMKHPDKFEDLYLKYAKRNENPPLAHTIYTTTPPELSNFYKTTNKDGMTFFKV